MVDAPVALSFMLILEAKYTALILKSQYTIFGLFFISFSRKHRSKKDIKISW